MATKNFVPRANEEGNIGTTVKNWRKGWFKNLFVSNELTDGSNIFTLADIQSYWDTHSYNQIVTVAKSGGDYTTIQGAIDSITDASANKLYVILIYPGEYSETIVGKDYVSLRCPSNRQDVIISGTNGTLYTFPDIGGWMSNLTFKLSPTLTAQKVLNIPASKTDSVLIDNCYFELTSDTDGIIGSLLDQNGGEVYLKNCVFYYTMTGTSIGVNTHNVFDIDGNSLLNLVDCHIHVSVADEDDNVKIIDDNSTLADSIEWDSLHIEGYLTHTTASGEIRGLEVTGVASKRLFKNSFLCLQASGGALNNARAIGVFLNSPLGGAIIESWNNRIEFKNFNGDTDVFKAQTGDKIISRYDNLLYEDDLFEGSGELDIIPSYEYVSSNGLSTTTSTAFQDKVSITLSIPGTYILHASWEVEGDTVDMIVESRVRDVTNNITELLDNTQINMGINNSSRKSGLERIIITASTTYTLQWNSNNALNTAGIRRAKLYAERKL